MWEILGWGFGMVFFGIRNDGVMAKAEGNGEGNVYGVFVSGITLFDFT